MIWPGNLRNLRLFMEAMNTLTFEWVNSELCSVFCEHDEIPKVSAVLWARQRKDTCYGLSHIESTDTISIQVQVSKIITPTTGLGAHLKFAPSDNIER